MKRNDRRTMQAPAPRKNEDGRNNAQQPQQQRPKYEADEGRAAARRASVNINTKQQSREASQPRQARFVRPEGGGSRESIAPTSANRNAAQQWFAMFVKQGGCKRIRQRFVNDLNQYKANGTTRAFDDENNALFNRYSDVILLDGSRVKLRQGPGGSDYIHASIVTGADFPIICAQAPVDESLERFWIMIVEQKVGVIVQLCQNQEGGREKCADYIPSAKDKQRNFGNVTVRIKEAQRKVVANPALRKTVVEASYNGNKTEVVHYLYDGWPDHDVPLSPTHFRQLRTTVHALATAKKCPVLVHCSAGVGRTGTYAAIELAIKTLINDNKPVQMPEIFRRIRGERALSMQNDLQFVFLHRAVIDAALEANLMTAEDRTKLVNPFIREYDELVVRKRKERRAIMERLMK